MLTPQQQAHFETFGFIVMRQAFSPVEMAEITGEFDDVLADDRQGQAFNGAKRQGVLGFIERRPLLTRLVEDDRIYEPLEQLLGSGFVWVGSDGNLYVGNTNWHPDGSNLNYMRIKVAFYLDPVTKESGCLRVIPGSHRPPLHENLKPLMERRGDLEWAPFSVLPAEIPCFPLESQPGDVVFFNQNLWHSSFGGRVGRRMFTLNFAAQPVAETQVEWLQHVYQSNLKNIQNMQYTQTGRVYTEDFLHSDRPRIQNMVGKLVELGFQ